MEACKTKFIKKYTIKHNNLEEKTIQNLIKLIDDDLKKDHFKSKDKEVVKDKQMLERLRARHKIYLQEIQNPSNQRNQIMTTNLSKRFCNPGCKGTGFQEEEYSETELSKMFKKTIDRLSPQTPENQRALVKKYKTIRKTLRNKNKKMLDKDDFYHAFDPITKARLKKDGAISGCKGNEGRADGRELDGPELY
jgi:hypothetical protein